VRLTIDNSITLNGISAELKDWLMEKLTFANPKYEEAIKYNRYLGNISPTLKMYRDLPLGISVPRGYLQLIENTLLNKGFNLSISDNRILASPIEVKSNIVLRPYQEKAKLDLLSHPNGMLIAPAASGKTIMGLDLFASLRQRMLWLTHTNRLSQQVIERIIDVFEDVDKNEIGFLGAGKWKMGNRITIGMIPTLVRREVQLPEMGREFGLVIIDEAHHVPATTFLKVLGYFSSYYLYGLTATPYRRDGLENLMFAAIGRPNSEVKRKEVRKKGSIITPRVIKRVVPCSKWSDNDYSYIMKELLPNNPVRLGMIVNDVVREAELGNYCIVINTRKNYAETLLAEIENRLPNRSVIATGDYSRKRNEESVGKIDRGEASILITTFELLGEGFDVPRLNRGFIALPFREKARVEQAVGRIQRTCEGKKDAILYDYVDENVGILKNQFINRANVYRWLGMKITEEI